MERADAIPTVIQTPSHFIPHEEKNKLIDLIGERIWSKLVPIWREMIEGIIVSEGYKIQEIAAQRQANAQKAARYEQMRFAKAQHEKRRKHTFAERGARLLDWRNAVRNSPLSPPVEPTLLEEDVVSTDVVSPVKPKYTVAIPVGAEKALGRCRFLNQRHQVRSLSDSAQIWISPRFHLPPCPASRQEFYPTSFSKDQL
jgi:hypothetical protein